MEKFTVRLIFTGIFLLVVLFITAFLDSRLHFPPLSMPVFMVIVTLIAARFLN